MRRMLAYLGLIALGATAARAEPDPELGASVRSNIATQIADPHPRFEGALIEGGDGQRSTDALIRYRAGKLKPLLKTNGKTDIGGQGGAGEQATVSIPIIQTPN